MGTERLTERFAFAGGKVRRPGVNGYTGAYPVVEGVLLCGPVSKHRRRYKAEAFAGDRVKRYDGRPVNVDHGTGGKYASQLGWIENPRHRADGMPIGDIGVKPTHPLAESFLFDAEHRPTNCGMSHVANCRTTRAPDGWDEVTEMVEADSVDVVVGPATTGSLYEQQHRRSAVTFSLKSFVERFGPKWGAKKWADATKLVEDMGALADAPVMDEPPADAADGDLKSALMAAITPMLDEAFESGDAAKVCSAIKDFIKLHAKHTGKDTPAEAPAEKPSDAEESKESRPTPAGLLAEAKAAGIAAPTLEHAIAVEGIPTAAGRKAVFELLAKTAKLAEAEQPRSGGKRPGAGPLPEPPKKGTTTTTESVPTDGKAFAESVRS